MTYAWIIDVDHHADTGAPAATNSNAVGIRGGSDDADMLAVLEQGKGRKFKMIDGDGDLIYEGRWVGPNWRIFDGRQLDETAFAPLDDFGRPNFGCTSIMYARNGDNTGERAEL